MSVANCQLRQTRYQEHIRYLSAFIKTKVHTYSINHGAELELHVDPNFGTRPDPTHENRDSTRPANILGFLDPTQWSSMIDEKSRKAFKFVSYIKEL